MRVLRVFFLGLIYGWFMKWIIDEIYTKDNLRRITNENALLRERIKTFEAPKSLETQSIKRTSPALQPQPVPTPKPTPRASGKDDLKMIKGVGPQMEGKLNNAGIYTFEQMSRLTTAELQSILGISKRGTQNADNLITQARKFAQEKSLQ